MGQILNSGLLEAQKEVGKTDVLVCGACHDVFHFVEEFQEHKQGDKCTGNSTIKENYLHEPKPQVWAFMLWKQAQYKKSKDGGSQPSSWEIYQNWCKLEPDEKETWIVAGRNIQTFTRLGVAKMQEVKTKVTFIFLSAK